MGSGQIVIHGGRRLSGTVPISGAKNAALPVLAATMLTRGPTVLHRVPHLSDVETIRFILQQLGMEAEWCGPSSIRVARRRNGPTTPPQDDVRRMRGSVCVLGPLLATQGRAGLALPGGCVIGPRPIDLHLKGLEALGAEFEFEGAHVCGRAGRLRGARIDLAGPRGSTVLGTANVMMAACLAEGRTVIEHAAREPEIQDLARYLNACGARVFGSGTPAATIDGVDELHGAEHELIPDRIEAGTFLAAAAVTGGRVTLEGAQPEHLSAVLAAARRVGMQVDCHGRAVTAGASGRPRPANLTTAPYPGFPTDMQPQFGAVLSLATGRSRIADRVYPERLTHLGGLRRMGAEVCAEGRDILIEGRAALRGAAVQAADLRAGAALVLAGLAAEGVTTIGGVDQIDRGYQDLEEKLNRLGARVERVPADADERRTA